MIASEKQRTNVAKKKFQISKQAENLDDSVEEGEAPKSSEEGNNQTAGVGKNVYSSKKESLESLKQHQAAKKANKAAEDEEETNAESANAPKAVANKKTPYEVLFEQNQCLANELERCRHRLLLKDNQLREANQESYSMREYIVRLEENLKSFKMSYDERQEEYRELKSKYEELKRGEKRESGAANRTYDLEGPAGEEEAEAVKAFVQAYHEMVAGLNSKLKQFQQIVRPLMPERSRRKSIFSSTLISTSKELCDESAPVFEETAHSKSSSSQNVTKTLVYEEEEETSAEKNKANESVEEDEAEEDEIEEEEVEEEEEAEEAVQVVTETQQANGGNRLSTILEMTLEGEATRTVIRRCKLVDDSGEENESYEDTEETLASKTQTLSKSGENEEIHCEEVEEDDNDDKPSKAHVECNETVTIMRRKSVSFAENLVNHRCIDETYDTIDLMNVTYQKSAEAEERPEEAAKRKSILKGSSGTDEIFEVPHVKNEPVTLVISPESLAKRKKSVSGRKSSADTSSRRRSRAFSLGEDGPVAIMSDDILSEVVKEENRQQAESKQPCSGKQTSVKAKSIFKSRQNKPILNEAENKENCEAVENKEKNMQAVSTYLKDLCQKAEEADAQNKKPIKKGKRVVSKKGPMKKIKGKKKGEDEDEESEESDESLEEAKSNSKQAEKCEKKASSEEGKATKGAKKSDAPSGDSTGGKNKKSKRPIATIYENQELSIDPDDSTTAREATKEADIEKPEQVAVAMASAVVDEKMPSQIEAFNKKIKLTANQTSQESLTVLENCENASRRNRKAVSYKELSLNT